MLRTKLQTMRVKAGLNHEQVAEAANISRSHYTLIESGKRTPSLSVAIRISNVLGCDVGDIFLSDKVAMGTQNQADRDSA